MQEYKIEIINEKEPWEVTMEYINSKRNWDIENQKYRKTDQEIGKPNLSECKIYRRGQYVILEHNDIIHYYENIKGCYLLTAVFYMEPDKPAEWKTMDKLIDLRMGIRQTEANCCYYVADILEGNKMTLNLYKKFMKLARAQDKRHHGSNTF